MSKRQLQLEPGKKYRGYGFINEYGEFEFSPEQTGIRAGEVKLLKSGDDYTVSTTKNYVILHVRVKRPFKPVEGIYQVMRKIDEIIKIFKEYEF